MGKSNFKNILCVLLSLSICLSSLLINLIFTVSAAEFPKKAVDLSLSQRLGTESQLSVAAPSDGIGLKVNVKRWDTAIINGSNVSTGKIWLKQTLLTLKYDSENYVLLKAGNKYAVNISYKVTEIGTPNITYHPQIALVYNNNVNQTVDNGSYVLAAKKHSAEGSFTMSCVVETGNKTNFPLRLAFGGVGTFEVKDITVCEISGNTADSCTVRYVLDSANERIDFVSKNSDLYVPEKEGYKFLGWYTDPDFKEGTEVKNAIGDMTLYAKWKADSFKVIKQNIDLDKCARIGDDGQLSVSSAADSGLAVNVKRWDTAIINGSNVSTGKVWLKQTLLTLKYESGNCAVLEAGKKYAVNISYKVTEIGTPNVTYHPQIALVYNNNVNQTVDNGSYVLAAKKHSAVGSFTMSCVVETGNKTNFPLRLAFGGVGSFEIDSVTVESVSADESDAVTVTYVDNSNTKIVIVQKGSELAAPELSEGFYGWFVSEKFLGKKVTTALSDMTVYAKRRVDAYSVELDFDSPESEDYYKSGNHHLSDVELTGADAALVKGVGKNGTSAIRLTYRKTDDEKSDYASNPIFDFYDSNTDARFHGVSGKQYLVSFYYKVENTDNRALELYVGKHVTYGATGHTWVNEFGSNTWQIKDASLAGSIAKEPSDGWVKVSAYVVPEDIWYPVILLRANNQKADTVGTDKYASVLIDDVQITEILPIQEDTYFGEQTYEEYETKVYDSTSESGVIGNKNGLEVSEDMNRTPGGKKSLKLKMNTNSLRLTGNTVISFNGKPLVTEKDGAYIVSFYISAQQDMNNLLWSINSIGGNLDNITANHQIELRGTVDIKARQWTKVTACIPQLISCNASAGMLSVAVASNGYDGKYVYIDDISVEQKVESAVIEFDAQNGTPDTYQRAFNGEPVVTLPNASKSGYLFEGWYTNPECIGKEFLTTDIFPEEKDEMTLYAKWTAVPTVATDFTAGSFDKEIYTDGVIPYENQIKASADPIYGNTYVGMTASAAWVEDSGIYGNGTSNTDGTLSLVNDTYNRVNDYNGRHAVALRNEDGTRFTVVKGQKYSIQFDYINGSNAGTSYIEAIISDGCGYGGVGLRQGQELTKISLHGTDTDYKTYQEYFVADRTGFVYITFTGRDDVNRPDTEGNHRVFIDNVSIKVEGDVKKVDFKVGNTTLKTVYGLEGQDLPWINSLNTEGKTFDGYYYDSAFENPCTDYTFGGEDLTLYIKYREDSYDVASDFTNPITVDFEDTELLNVLYRQSKTMTYWSRELIPEWKLITNNRENAFDGNNYIKLNGFTTYWNQAKLALYDANNPSKMMILEKGAKYRVTVMARCEDKYDIPNLTVCLENPSARYLLANNGAVALEYTENGDKGDYMTFTADIEVSEDLAYLPSLAIRKNTNDLQTLYLDSVSVEKLRNYTVKFEENGGTEIQDATVQAHELCFDPGSPYREGYEFAGWYQESDFQNIWDFEKNTVEKDITLYAKWQLQKTEVSDEKILDVPREENNEDKKETAFDSGRVPILSDADPIEKSDKPVVEEENASILITVLIIAGGIIVLVTAVFVFFFVMKKKKKNI